MLGASMENIKEKLMCEGFEGFVSVRDLKKNFENGGIPKVEGVYQILRLKDAEPQFLTKGTGGYHNDKEPNVSIDELRYNWIDAEPIVYIGKATELFKRIKQYMRFGSGKNVGHYGGRYIWQLADSDDLVVCWKCVEDSRRVEAAMIAEFKKNHNGKRPFANLQD